MRCWLGLLVLVVMVGCKARPDATTTTIKDLDLVTEPVVLELDEFGFDPDDPTMTPAARKGLQTVFAGLGFRMLVEEQLFQKLLTFDPNRQWMVYGNPPSPKSRIKLNPGGEGVFGRDARGITSNGKDVGTNFAVYEEDGRKYVNFTCLQCHSGVVAGMQVAGLGNSHIDQAALIENLKQYRKYRDFFNEDLSGLGQELVQLLADIDDTELDHLKWFTLYSETVLRPALKGATARGDDFGPFPVWQLLARLKDPGAQGFDLLALDQAGGNLEKLVRDTPLGPVDRRPWWLRKHDTKSYVYGDTLTEARAGKDFAINFTVPHAGHNQTYKQRARITADILEFALWTKSPPYPFEENVPSNSPLYDPKPKATTIDAGREIYNDNCASCHGRVVKNTIAGDSRPWQLRYKSQEYAGKHDFWQDTCLDSVLYSTEQDDDGDPVHPLWKDDTDLTYSCALMRFNRVANGAAPIRKFFEQDQFGISEAWLPAVYNPEKPGYRAPPLVGIWASAPYMHNGSMPTLGDVMQHQDLFEGGGKPRPLAWERVFEVSKALSYDAGMVGMQVVPYFAAADVPKNPQLPYDHVKQVAFRALYDTREMGKGREGASSCGSKLNGNDKNKLLAFFKVFTDQNVAPDQNSCPHPPKPRQYDYTGTDYNLKDHDLCAKFYQAKGVPSL